MSALGEPSHYEVTLTEQLPPFRAKAIRIAERLSHLPVELVEPIIQDLPLFRVLELLSVPTCGPSLTWAVERSPTWSWLFKDNMSRLKRLWASLNRLSWIWCSEGYMAVKDLPQQHLRLTSLELQRIYNPIGREDPLTPMEASEEARGDLEKCLTMGLRRLLGYDLYNHRPSHGHSVHIGFTIPQLRALCLFLPPSLVSMIKRRNLWYFGRHIVDAKLPESRLDCMVRGENNKDLDLSSADFSRYELWTVETAHRFLPFLSRADKLLRESYSAELLSAVELYDQFPGKLKLPFAPQAPACRKRHVAEHLRRDAARILTKPLRRQGKVLVHPNSKEIFMNARSYRFRYPDPVLIPYDWCFILFEAVRRQYPLSDNSARYPEALLPEMTEAEAGVQTIYHRNPGQYTRLLERLDDTGMPNAKRLQAILNQDPKYAPFLPYVSGPPRPLRELSWLKSFLVCVEWMEKAFQPLASACKSLVDCKARLHLRDLGNDALFPPPDYGRFVAEAPAELIASHILRDVKLCDEEDLMGQGPGPSPLGLHLPEFSTSRGREIARYLVASTDLGMDIRQLTYDSLKGRLVRNQGRVGVIKGHGDGYKLAFEVPMDGTTFTSKGAAATDAPSPTEPPVTQDLGVTEGEVDIAARVLRTLLGSSLPPDATAADALKVLSDLNLNTDNHPMDMDEPATTEQKSWDDTVKQYLITRPPGTLPGNDTSRRCYICNFYIHVPHKTHPSMCIPCGNFNQAGSDLSMPGNLNLFGKTALVTGARVNLGYHVALRLLRCGARVIASTRYPRDAVSRYEAEPDSDRWIDNLRVVGADFRSARDAFELVHQTRTIIAAWGSRLDILINNAAQTLTDSIKTEGQAVHRENLLKEKVSATPLLEQQYRPRVRGGAQSLIEGPAADFSKGLSPALSPASISDTATNVGLVNEKSSWVQSLPEIPYEDIISAHSVNTFVPLILIRELLPLMGLPQSSAAATSSPVSPAASDPSPSIKKSPLGYIVNVSSREGIFESRPQHAHKAGHHVHTNMSKAALNMITETEAGPAWTTRRVAMNTVDPGYMSAAPEMEDLFDGTRPIGWEDGAGRVLWPVAVGEGGGEKGKQGQAVWGRFLKHYGAVRVETGWGRG